MLTGRALAGLILLLAAASCAIAENGWALGLMMGAGLIVYRLTFRSWRQALRFGLPVLTATILFWALQQLAANPPRLLPLKMVAVFLFASTAFRVFPWTEVLLQAPQDKLGFHVALYFLFVRHFAVILGEETMRLLRAWRWSHRGLKGRLFIRSLAHAVAALFNRCFIRAECFFAAQLLKGLAK